MIDAYEIGIQLLLQDDVSDGLAIINRELANVDQAIAATSAQLMHLVAQAQGAAKAVSALSNPRVSAAVESVGDPGNDGSAAPAENGHTRLESSHTSKLETQSGSPKEVRAPEPTEPPPKAASRQSHSEPNYPIETVVVSAAPAGAPATVREEVPASYRRTDNPNVAPPVSAAVGRAEMMKTSSTQLRDRANPPVTSTFVQQKAASTIATPPNTSAITASIGSTRVETGASPREELDRHRTNVPRQLPRERAVSPWTGVADRKSRMDAARIQQSSTAPEARGQGQSQSRGGMVMLDGRLVGQWLSEHMAREASRPPSGTSFFDPRQMPAWNVSGAI